MDQEKINFEIKNEINLYYDLIKGDIDYFCQSKICKMEQNEMDTKEVKAIYLKWIKIVETIQNKVMDAFKNFISIQSNLFNKSKLDLLHSHLKSVMFIPEKDISERKQWQFPLGLLIQCDWWLSANQLDFIRSHLVKPELWKNIKLCLEEVNIFI